MPAYLVYICEGVTDRKELETYWEQIPRTFAGFEIKLHTAYRPFEILEGEGPVKVSWSPSSRRWKKPRGGTTAPHTPRCARTVCAAQSILACSSKGECQKSSMSVCLKQG
jgi:hypothetical protein